MRRISILATLFSLLLVAVGCSGPEPEVKVIKETVEVVVEATVEVPVTVIVNRVLTAEPLPTYTPYPTYTPVAETKGASVSQADPESKGAETVLSIGDSPWELDRAGMVIRVTGVSLSPLEARLNDSAFAERVQEYLDIGVLSIEGVVTVGSIAIQVENTTDQAVEVHPAQGWVAVGSEVVVPSLMLSDDVGGPFEPGVVKEGAVLFMIKRTAAADVKAIGYQILAPFDEDFNSLSDENYEFFLTLE